MTIDLSTYDYSNGPVEFEMASGGVAWVYGPIPGTENYYYGRVGPIGAMWAKHGTSIGVAHRHLRRPAPKKHSGWMNVYHHIIYAGLYPTKEEADRQAGPNRIACVYVEFTEGEGL